MFVLLSPGVNDPFSSGRVTDRVNPTTWKAERDHLLDELACWILELNLSGFVCERRVREAAAFAAIGAFRSGATPREAMDAGKTIVNRHLGTRCS